MSDVEVRYGAPAPRTPGNDRGWSLDEVRRAIYTLYRRLSPDTVHEFSASIPAEDVTVRRDEDLISGTQRVAHALVEHLRLPDTRITVTFTPMPPGRAGRVLLGTGPQYSVEIDSTFVGRRRDIGAVLAHEVTHVFLEYHHMRYEDEILTDTTAAYLGVGWPLLDSHRTAAYYTERLGYLGSPAFGYALGRRAVAFSEDPLPWLTSTDARSAYRSGYAVAYQEWTQAPLASADPASRRRYDKDLAQVRRRLDRGAARPHAAAKSDRYAFSGRSPLRVTFNCPICSVRISLPVASRAEICCQMCGTLLDCDT
ncbi:hypothetical protein [Plantactinospora soyae]|uniref:Uncharacterized protein n=1 Tax=Plantactinospora soyae TaxID=1544732 RepID=A0A927LYM4_9ACTN|nr:hypothetical protein [Plantactinospora soyae]MBE1484938.1 hypothetical protein [Plantactinospora soyae]